MDSDSIQVLATGAQLAALIGVAQVTLTRAPFAFLPTIFALCAENSLEVLGENLET